MSTLTRPSWPISDSVRDGTPRLLKLFIRRGRSSKNDAEHDELNLETKTGPRDQGGREGAGADEDQPEVRNGDLHNGRDNGHDHPGNCNAVHREHGGIIRASDRLNWLQRLRSDAAGGP